MKKGLSVLLIAAALFGFYGGAVNIQDVLAAKAYWEDKSEQTTADLNKLEDGLKTLDENKQAYLDGLDLVKDGEEDLVKGEEDLAAGEAELAQGEADYAAAPGKLADARAQLNKGESDLAAGKKKLADGEKTLADGYVAYEQGQKDLKAGKAEIAAGEESIDGLTKLINGTTSILNGYDKDWRPGYEKLKDGREQLHKGTKASQADLTALAVFLPDASKGAYVDAVKEVAENEKESSDAYKDFIKGTNTMGSALPAIQQNVKKAYEGSKNLLAAMKSASDNYVFAGIVSGNKDTLTSFAALISDSSLRKQYTDGIATLDSTYKNFDSIVDAQYKQYMATDEGKQTEAYQISKNMDAGWSQFFASNQGKAAVNQAKQGIALVTWQKTTGKSGQPSTDEEKAQFAQILANISDGQAQGYIKENSPEAKAGVEAAVKEKVDAGIKENVREKVINSDDLKNGRAKFTGAMEQIVAGLSDVNDKVNGDKSAIKNTLLPGLKLFNASATDKAIDDLSAGQDSIANGVRTVANAVLSNSTLKSGVEDKMGKDAITLLRTYSSNPSLINSKLADFARFEGQMDTAPGLESALTKARTLLRQTKADGLKSLKKGRSDVSEGSKALAAAEKKLEKGEEDLAAGKKELAAGEAELADGYKQYRQGLADYEAAPAKLEAGRQAVEEGRQKLADGRKELAAGKEKLAEYEDGEKQVRDGLATLMASDRYADLETILERRGGDDNFDDADKHLNIPEGLEAVGTGREYQADTGEIVTKELSGRVLGSGLGLGAAVVAILAALLSLFKKFKSAAALAVATAAVGIGGMIAGNNAGMEMSSIAGSNIGATPMIAAGILAVVAALFAIVNFTAKKES